MRKSAVFFCFILAVFTCSVALAQDVEEERTEVINGEVVGIDEGEQGVKVELASQWLSKYLSTGGVAFSKDPVLQSSLMVSFPNGFYGQVWHSTNIDANLLDNPGAELDLYLGWSGRLYRVANPFINTLEVDFHISYQAYPKLSKMENHYLGIGLEIKRPFDLDGGHRLSPFIAVEYYYPLSGNSGEQGVYSSVGLKHSWKIWGPVSLEQSVRGTYDSGVYGMESGLIGAYTASLQYKATDHLRVDLGQVQYSVPITRFHDRKNEIVYGAGIRYEF
jgi:hypothetical protein